MRVGIVDADLIQNKKHRFPNLASMKLSSYHKSNGDNVNLLMSYDDIEEYDKVYVQKVFSNTNVPETVMMMPNVTCGGSGFLYDNAPNLPDCIEHIMPDYSLYNDYVVDQVSSGAQLQSMKMYTDYSLGFTTRGCIRGCQFCINKNYKACVPHSTIDEFLDVNRKYICLLDDNVFACNQWKSIFESLNETGKRFQFKQGLDERLLTDEKCDVLFKSNWIGEYYFAFDNIKDGDLIERKLNMIRNHTTKRIFFYMLCAYNHDNPSVYDEVFWTQDIVGIFERIKILTKYHALPYLMRYKDYEASQYRGMYITLARYCNQPGMIKNKSFREFCLLQGEDKSSYKYMKEFECAHPEIAELYFDMHWWR